MRVRLLPPLSSDFPEGGRVTVTPEPLTLVMLVRIQPPLSMVPGDVGQRPRRPGSQPGDEGSNPSIPIARRTPLVGAAHAGLNIEAGRAAPSSLRPERDSAYGMPLHPFPAGRFSTRFARQVARARGAGPISNRSTIITPRRSTTADLSCEPRARRSVAEHRFLKPGQDGFKSLRSHRQFRACRLMAGSQAFNLTERVRFPPRLSHAGLHSSGRRTPGSTSSPGAPRPPPSDRRAIVKNDFQTGSVAQWPGSGPLNRSRKGSNPSAPIPAVFRSIRETGRAGCAQPDLTAKRPTTHHSRAERDPPTHLANRGEVAQRV